MASVVVDFGKAVGALKPLHSVNNGPLKGKQRGISNYEAYCEAGFPFARTHDAAFLAAFGGQHTVDIINIFPDFDKDENDPASYDFDLTDEYMENIMSTGTRVFYRLGNKIEHESKRYGSIPPKDYGKWARICEHIIRHMNEGWANGHHYGIEYWEIWNEPDNQPQCWDGPNASFYPLYDTAARHLKKCFPDLKIGGPALASVRRESFLDGFFGYLTRDPADPAPLDFFSFHLYGTKPEEYRDAALKMRTLCDAFGYKQTELILNEWNYVKAWRPKEEMLYSYRTIRSLKGSSFAAAVMIALQHSPLDQLMYYDARPYTAWNGLFDSLTQEPLPPYYSFWGFGQVYRLGTESFSASDDGQIYALAAKNETDDRAMILFTYYRDGESLDGAASEDAPLPVRLEWSGFSSPQGVEVRYRILDRDHSMETVSEEGFFGERGAHLFRIRPYTTVLAELHKLPSVSK